MKSLILILAFFIGTSAIAQQVPVIPLPNKYSKTSEKFVLSGNTVIDAIGAPAERTAQFFRNELLLYTGITVSAGKNGHSSQVLIRLNEKGGDPAEAYRLTMSKGAIQVSASDEKGLFNGMISLLQIIRKSEIKNGAAGLECWNIEDKPRYGWRGFMLDESRHFFGKEKVKSILEWMAFYKLNRFHWHLTDQQGWRLEIRQYPRLTLVGGIGNHTDKNSPARYYTQQDIREIVRFASERNIEILPEIDMPGHATAANMAYPQFSGGGNEAHPEFTFNPGKEETYTYLSDILKEVDVLFPSEMLHFGGDEVSFGTDKWLTNPDVIALMKNKQLKDLKAVEFYFNRRMGDTISRLNNRIMAWDEAVEAGLPIKNTTIFWWRHDKPEQLKSALDKGYSVVICPRLPLYFDFVQDSLHKFGRRWQGAFNPLEKVYQFSCDQLVTNKSRLPQVLGIQANLWTETVGSEARLDYLLFPRISALAEAAWTEDVNRNFADFKERLKADIELFRKEGIYYFDPNAVNSHSEPAAPDS